MGSGRRCAAAALILLAIGAGGHYLFGGGGVGSIASKAAPALCLAGVVALVGADRGRWLVALGLACCAAGDALLEMQGLFVAGTVAFLAGHAAFVASFVGQARGRAPLVSLPFVAWGVAALWATWPHLGALRMPVVVYVAVICAMMWRAVAAGRQRRNLPGLVGALGALSFGLSDTIIALRSWGGMADPGSLVVMGLYWAGLAGLAASTAPGSRSR